MNIINNQMLDTGDKAYKFSLDIGTRTVIGILTSKQGRNLAIEDYEIIEHPDRAMFDGQVHDISEVSEVVKEVRTRLENRNQVHLDSVSIAAAGRALRTEKVVLEKKLNISDEIDQGLIDSLEMEAIQIAGERIKISQAIVNTLYYCVGYSIVGISLDGISVRNPIGHSASNLVFSLVATFLPHNVSDTLHRVVTDAGLSIEAMTLEPIAALEVSVPSNLRLLNLAIIDIGAGTSDIALTKDGNIFSYGMVDVAGDEISEALMKKYLLEFGEAERLKLNLIKQDTHAFTDIVGFSYELTTEEILQALSPTLDEIAQKIANSVLEINKEVPDAVFLVGGSSQMPTLMERIAGAIKIDENKINLKSSDKLSHVLFHSELLKSPEFVTPIGIAYMSHFIKQKEFISVMINAKVYRLFSRNHLTISDALVLAGFNAKRLIQTRGKSLRFRLDGAERILQGEAGEPSQILLNGRAVTLHTPIKHMDMIEITKPIVGKDASYRLEEVLDYNAYIFKNREKMPLIKAVLVNGEEQEKSYPIRENDEITVIRNDEEDFNFEEALAESIDESEVPLHESPERFDEQTLADKKNEEISNSEECLEAEAIKAEDDKDTTRTEAPASAEATEMEAAERFETKHLRLILNQKPLQVQVQGEHYFLEDLLALLHYNASNFYARFLTRINGRAIEENCMLHEGDEIEFIYRN